MKMLSKCVFKQGFRSRSAACSQKIEDVLDKLFIMWHKCQGIKIAKICN